MVLYDCWLLALVIAVELWDVEDLDVILDVLGEPCRCQQTQDHKFGQ